MREEYFTLESIEKWTDDTMRIISLIQRPRKMIFHPGQAALIVVDMQRYFYEPKSHAFIPAIMAIIPGIQRLIDAFIDMKRPVICTRHLNTDLDSGMMKTWWGELIRASDPMSEIIPELQAFNLQTIVKTQYDAFHATELESLLKEKGVEQVVITGVMTHLCCETTARGAFMRNFEVFFPIDGTATYKEEFHRAALLNLAHGFASVTRVENIVNELKENIH